MNLRGSYKVEYYDIWVRLGEEKGGKTHNYILILII